MSSSAYRQNLFEYGKYSVGHTLAGVILGVIINQCMEYFQHKSEHFLLWFLLQLIVSIVILYIIETKISLTFAGEWQSITPGLFFVSFYFGVQSNFFTNITKVTDSIRSKMTKCRNQ